MPKVFVSRNPLHYLAAIAIVVGAALFRLGLNFIVPSSLPVAPFYVAVLIPALLWGLGPALLGLAVAIPLGWYMFIPPTWSFAIGSVSAGLSVLIYAAMAGAITWLGVRHHAITEALRAREWELADAAERFEETLGAADVGIWEFDPVSERVLSSASTDRLFGLDPMTGPHPFADYIARIHPEDAEGMMAETRRTAASRSVVRLEYRLVDPDGGERWIASRGRTILTTGGRERMVGAIFDISDRKAVEDQLRLSEKRLRRMVEAAPHPMMLHADDGDIQAISASWYRLGGWEEGRFETFDAWVDAVFDGEAGAVRAEVAAAFADGTVRHLGMREILAGHGGDHGAGLGERRVWDITVVPLEHQLGRRRWAVTSCVDVTDQVEASGANQLLLRELAHRVKNTLAIVVAIANQTLGKGGVPEGAYRAFAGRLNALAATHDILVGTDWTGADLRSILQNELEPFLAEPDLTAGSSTKLPPRRADRIRLEGPSLPLRPQTALNLGLVLHELVANAATFGALSVPEGRLTVRWRVVDGDGATRTFDDTPETAEPSQPPAAPSPSVGPADIAARTKPEEVAARPAYRDAPEVRLDTGARDDDGPLPDPSRLPSPPGGVPAGATLAQTPEAAAALGHPVAPETSPSGTETGPAGASGGATGTTTGEPGAAGVSHAGGEVKAGAAAAQASGGAGGADRNGPGGGPGNGGARPPRLELEWRESDGPPVAQPATTGFGTRLLGRSIRALGGESRFEFAPDGFVCRLTLPLPDEPTRVPRTPARFRDPVKG